MSSKSIASPVQQHRRDRLRALISDRQQNPRQFALSIEKSEAQINDMLGKRKSFGEKVAMDIATRAGLRPDYFDIDGNYEAAVDHQANDPANATPPRIAALVEKLKTLPANHPAIQAVEWALRDISPTPDPDSARKSGKSRTDPGWTDVHGNLDEANKKMNPSDDPSKIRQK